MPATLLALLFAAYLVPGLVCLVVLWLWQSRNDP